MKKSKRETAPSESSSLSQLFKVFNKDLLRLENIDSKELKKKAMKKENAFFVSAKESDTINYLNDKRMTTFVANRESLDPEKVQLIYVYGSHKKADLEILEKIGDFYYLSEGSKSKYYSDLIKGKKIGEDIFLNSDPNLNSKYCFAGIVANVINTTNLSSYEKVKDWAEKIYELCSIANVPHKKHEFKALRKINEEEKEMKLKHKVQILSGKQIKQLSSKLTKEQNDVITGISVLRYNLYYSKYIYNPNHEDLFQESPSIIPGALNEKLDATIKYFFSSNDDGIFFGESRRNAVSTLESLIRILDKIDSLTF